LKFWQLKQPKDTQILPLWKEETFPHLVIPPPPQVWGLFTTP